MSNKKPEMIVISEDRLRKLFEKIVEDAQQSAFLIFRKEQERKQKEEFNGFRATEERLSALPILKAKLKDDQEHLKDLEAYGEQRRSADILRFQKGGVRLSDEDIKATLIQDLKAKIANTEWEIECMAKALAIVETDFFYPTVPRRYFDRAKDAEVAGELNCDATTVWRNRNRLVRVMAIRLYGPDAYQNKVTAD